MPELQARPDPAGMAPGAPGIDPTWASSDKDLVGTALGPARLWFTLGHGILNEVYYPRVDLPQIRDLGFIVADGAGFWVEVKRLDPPRFTTPAAGIPLPTVVHRHDRFTLSLRVCPDPDRDVLLLDLVLEGDAELRPYVLLAPHLGGTGRDNLAEATRHRGRRVLWAEQGPFGLALLAGGEDFADAMGPGSAGCVGVSDGWQDFAHNGRMNWRYGQAGPGNVALMGALERRCTLALGFATSRESAATLALSALAEDFDALMAGQAEAWRDWHRLREVHTPPPNLPPALLDQVRHSAQVLKTHQDKTYAGALVASLSVPWGNQGEERGGYHLVWPRDLVESAQALLALGGCDEARDTLRYLMASQEANGHWTQNQWLGGKPYWSGIQLDETAFPVLLAAQLAERGALDGIAVTDMMRRALAFIAITGPASDQDRWEEDAGLNPYTLAVCIAALTAGAALLPEPDAGLARTVADYWNARLEDWCLARDTSLDRQYGLAGHYVREAPSEVLSDVPANPGALCRLLPIKNQAHDPQLPAALQIGVDFLQLVRLGLRRADDPGILDSLKLADALLKTDTPAGPVWHRYNGDGYGEHADGGAFDGTGQGRGWPLLGGERGHYALAAGADPLPYLQAMNAMAGRGGLIPEQVWDSAPLPDLGLLPGRPSGSAMPLAWAHAEFVKLAASLPLGRPGDRPEAVWSRYRGKRPDPAAWVWSPVAPLPALPPGKDLLVLLPSPAVLHLGFDGWQGPHDRPSEPLGLGLHGLSIPAAELAGHAALDLTLRWLDSHAWLGWDCQVRLAPGAGAKPGPC